MLIVILVLSYGNKICEGRFFLNYSSTCEPEPHPSSPSDAKTNAGLNLSPTTDYYNSSSPICHLNRIFLLSATKEHKTNLCQATLTHCEESPVTQDSQSVRWPSVHVRRDVKETRRPSGLDAAPRPHQDPGGDGQMRAHFSEQRCQRWE